MNQPETFKFNVYKHPNGHAKFVKIGFSWPAAIFGLLWMLAIKKWKLGFLFIVLHLVLAAIETICDQLAQENLQVTIYIFLTIAYAALWLTPGFRGNRWQEELLINSGYGLSSTITAINKKEALRKYIEDQNVKT